MRVCSRLGANVHRALRMRRLVLLLIAAIAATPCAAEEMADGFVYLRDVDPTILQDMRYAGTDNFTGHAVNGYDAPECVLVREAAEGLKAVQEEFKAKGLSLKVYDCYRPARAVKAFVDWSKLPDDAKAKATYYPALPKSALFPDYIALVSGHSRGATMDLTLVPLDAPAVPPSASSGAAMACTAAQGQWAPDASLDMGTTFDCFDVKANTVVPGLAPEQRQNRQMLVDVMRRHGFKNYDKEWWHYTLENEPFPSTIFDFPIEPRETRNDKK
jgi:D-alanyl-D-alanine dipeptidase